MNYYQYKRREPRSGATDFIKPFLVIIVFIGIIFAAWKYLGPSLKGGEEALSSEKVYLDIATGGAKAMTAGSSEWKTVPTNIYLYEGEKIKTQSDGRVTLTMFDKDAVRLDKSTELDLITVRRDVASNEVVLDLKEGKLWLNIDETGASKSEFTVRTGLLTLKSSGGTFAVGYPGSLYVISGSVKVDVESMGNIVKSSTIGVGQELVVDEQIAANLAEGLTKEIIFALDDAFKSSNWYRWNRQQEEPGQTGDETLTDETGAEDGADTTTTEEDKTLSEDSTDTTSEDTTTTKDETTVDENTNGLPATPKILEPGSNGDTVTLDDVEQIISGTVSAGTEGVIVNDYRLSKFVAGSGKFSYSAKVAYGNLKAGDNEFEVIAVDKAGNKSKAATITLNLPQTVIDKAKETTEDTTTTAPTASSAGGVKITAPNGGANLTTSETSFVISGEVPAGTAKVLVNDYQLQGFTAGGTTFKYNAKNTLGTLEIGALNTYTVKAYDADDKLVGTASMTIDVEASATGAGDPVITMPSASATYSTTLNQLVVGGTVGKWVEVIYVNGEKLTEYIPGTESWKKTVNLAPGENKFSVYGEKSGEKTSTVSITINYQN